MTRRTLAAVLAVLMVATLVACTNFTRDAYRTVATAAVTYDAIMTSAGDAYAAGAISEEQKEQIIVYGDAAHGAIHSARVALEAYVVAGEVDGPIKDKLISTLATLAQNLGRLQQYGQEVLGLFAPKEA